MGPHRVPLPHTPTTPSHSTQAQLTEVARRHTDKSWEEIIPEEELARMRAVEDQQEQLQLYLPPRQRKVKVSVCLCARVCACVHAHVRVHTLCVACTQSYAEEKQESPVKGKKGQAPPPGRRGGGQRKAEQGGRSRGADRCTVEVDVEGFSAAEIRRWVRGGGGLSHISDVPAPLFTRCRFVRSYQRFPDPMNRFEHSNCVCMCQCEVSVDAASLLCTGWT